MKVSEIMSHRLFTCSEDDSLHRAAQLMWEQDIGCVPVVKGTRVVGILTDRDICMSAYLNGKPLAQLRTSDVMSRDIRACGPNDDVNVAEERMAKAQVHRLPVIENESLIGLIALNDLAVAGATKNQPRLDQVGATLAQICRRRTGDGVSTQQDASGSLASITQATGLRYV